MMSRRIMDLIAIMLAEESKKKASIYGKSEKAGCKSCVHHPYCQHACYRKSRLTIRMMHTGFAA
jgi:radical SAM protein with 4Fe4S-binding SPASM domain